MYQLTVARFAQALLIIGAAVTVFPPGTRVYAQSMPSTAPVSLPDVIVTARKIPELLQNVPMSVRVIDGVYLDASRITGLQELQLGIPGLVINSTGMFGAGFSLRGVADQRVGGLSVAPYLGGVYLGNANLAIARLFDIERIEILKGPQGALYGRNSTGGSINFIPQGPKAVSESALEVSYGSFETGRLQGYLNLPSGKVSTRLAFIRSDGDGYIRNSIDTRRFGRESYWGVRGSMNIDATSDVKIQLLAQHIRDDGGSGDLWLSRPDFLTDPHDIRLATVTLRDPYLITEADEMSAHIDVDAGGVTFRSITGYTRSRVRNVDDCAGLPTLRGCVRSALPNDLEGWSQEIQLLFPRAGALEGIAGAYHAQSDSTLAFFQTLPLVSTRPIFNYRAVSRNPVTALFGQATLHFAEAWSATAGLRFGRESYRVTTVGTGIRDSPTPLTAKREQNDLTWHLDLVRKLGNRASAYASVSTGRKSGGFVPSTIVNGQLDTFGPETLTSYEFGLKGRWFDQQLTMNAAAFFYDFKDLQVSKTSNIGVVLADNAATATLYGLDGEFAVALSNRWSLSAGFVWLPKREFVEYQDEAVHKDLSGNLLVRAPQLSGNVAIGYERPLKDIGLFAARLEYGFRSAYFYTPENDPNLEQRGFGQMSLSLRFESVSKRWYAFASGRNLANEDYFTQVFLQSSPGRPANYEFGIGHRF